MALFAELNNCAKSCGENPLKLGAINLHVLQQNTGLNSLWSGVCWGLCLGLGFTCDSELLLGRGETDGAVGETEGKMDGRRL